MYLSQTVLRAAQIRPNGIAVMFEGLHRSWSDFAERVARMAGALVSMGVKPKDRIAVLAENSDRYVELYYAIPWAGAVIVPLNTRWTHSELSYAIDDAGISVLFVDEPCVDNLAELIQACPGLKTVISLNDPAASSYETYEALVSAANPIDPQNEDPDSLYGIFYTGGTTGQSKGVMLSNRGLWVNSSYIVREYDYRPADVAAHVAPMYHMAAGANLFAITNAAATHCVLRRFEPEKLVEAIERDKIAHLPMVPTMIAMLLDTPGLSGRDLSSIRRIVYGAAPMSDSLRQKLMQVFPEVALLQVYGQTEMSPVVTTLSPECHCPSHPLYAKRLSVGQPTYATTVRIVDKAGNEVQPGESGEILAKGPGAMLGYWNKPEQTQATLVDGWVHTGDYGYMDADGYLYLQDRVKDMIISGAENVYSVEVENALLSHHNIQACAVIGVPDSKWGERVHAVIVAKDKQAFDAADVSAHCRALIADYKTPRSMSVVDSLPLSAAGKILKAALRKSYRETPE